MGAAHHDSMSLLMLSLAAISLICAGMTASAQDKTEKYRIAVLSDDIPSLDQARVGKIVVRLRQSGFEVRTLNCAEAAAPEILNPSAFDCLLLADSPRFPGIACDNLLAFIEGGGDLVLLGGRAFEHPTCRIGGKWVTEAQFRESLLSIPTQNVFFSFDGEPVGWTRSARELSHPSRALRDEGPSGGCMRLDIRDIGQWQWDTFANSLPGGFPAGHDLICFMARGGPATREMAFEIDEHDGSRWIATVPLEPEWKRFVLNSDSFRFHADGSPKNRGGKDDRLQMSNTVRISFGLAAGFTNYGDGDHAIWLDEIGSAASGTDTRADFSRRVEINAFGDDETYGMKFINSVTVYPQQDLTARDMRIEGKFAGISAVGFAFANKSRFIPILDANDVFDRSMGWAGGMLVNYDGQFKGSNWLLFGITSGAFYESEGFLSLLPETISRMAGSGLAEKSAALNDEGRNAVIELTEPAPEGFIRLSEDGRRFLLPDGRPFFMIGTNYLGPADRICRLGGECFDARILEADFRRARDAGINCMRIWVGVGEADKARRDAISQCARKYGIYLLIHIGNMQKEGEMIAETCRNMAEMWKDEPMVIGYDLINEPYLGVVGAVRFGGQPSPLLRLNPYEKLSGLIDRAWVEAQIAARPAWPQIAGWADADEVRNLYAAYSLYNKYTDKLIAGGEDYSTLTGADGKLPMDREFAEFAKALDATFAQWIGAQVGAIRAVDKNHLITVGYNTVLSCLPCNERFDFVSQHVYQRPMSYKEILKNATTLDRLAKVWPDQPVTLGEFGYSNGLIIGGKYLDPHSSCVGEMLHYLSALARGHSGCMKWMLTDWPIPMMRDNCPWMGEGSVYEERFGLYRYDGTPRGRPKPIVHALRFLREYYDKAGPGGEINVDPANSPIGVRYVFRGKNALFVGGTVFVGEGIEFGCDVPVNLMLMWGDGRIRIMATGDAHVTIKPSEFVQDISAFKCDLKGNFGGLSIANTVIDIGEWLRIGLLEGEALELSRQ
ncbi:MAG TPA: hypothetical protein PL033_17975 [Candidatus Brocadiia bacterium]|nr:hypothetical protein [Candidatus Brocadiia bacterium]